jgi:hypothetical protein
MRVRGDDFKVLADYKAPKLMRPQEQLDAERLPDVALECASGLPRTPDAAAKAEILLYKAPRIGEATLQHANVKGELVLLGHTALSERVDRVRGCKGEQNADGVDARVHG